MTNKRVKTRDRWLRRIVRLFLSALFIANWYRVYSPARAQFIIWFGDRSVTRVVIITLFILSELAGIWLILTAKWIDELELK